MTCRRAFEEDLPALARGEGDAELRAHVDGCADCAAELAVWRELDGLLRAGAVAPTGHPDPDVLVAFVDAPSSLGADARVAIERHVAACRPCADEVRGLGSFGPATVTGAPKEGAVARAETSAAAHTASSDLPAAPTAAPATRGARAVEAARASGEPRRARGLGALLWHPAFAYALVVLLLVPLLRDQLPKLGYETRAVDARRAAPAAAAAPAREERQATGAPATEAPAAHAPTEHAARTSGDGPRTSSDRERDVGAPAAKLADRAPAAAAARRDRPGASERVAADALAKRGAPLGEVAAPRQAAEPEARPPAAEAFGSTGLVAGGGEGKAGPEQADEGLGAAARRAPAAAPPVLELQPQKPTVFGAEVLGKPIVLRMTPPAELVPGPLTVTVRARANQRELTRLAINGADAIAIAIPGTFLAPGDYVVTLQPVKNGLVPAGPPVLLGFTIRAPTAR